MKRVVVALGGNALSRRGEPFDVATMRARVAVAASELAAVAQEHDLVVTHGNGPQVGYLAANDPSVPLDVVGAESEGLIGYLLEEALASELGGDEVAALLTQVEVEPSDPAFERPTKPIGRVHSTPVPGWTMVREPGHDGFRRVVASPEPRRIREIPAIRALLAADLVVVCAGGGGIPVVVADGIVRGAPAAVVDKDLTAALLATAVEADILVLLTDVAAVYDDWPARTRPLAIGSPQDLRRRALPAGSMGPKVEAACRFVDATGRRACIGALGELARILAGEAGTAVVRELPCEAHTR